MPSSEVFHKFKAGQLHSGGKAGPVVRDRKQAIAIMLSEREKGRANGGVYPEIGTKVKAHPPTRRRSY